MKGVRIERTSHMNIVVEDFDASVAHMKELYGAELILDLPTESWHACLVEIGNVILELFAPKDFIIVSRLGPHHLGVEYKADVDEARVAAADHGVRVIRELKVAFHGNPADALGVDYEFYAGSFHENDPPILSQPLKPASYWRDEHPLGVTGQKGYTHAVADLEEASRFLQSFLLATPRYEAERPALGARAVGLEVGDGIVELLAPSGPGPLQDELYRTGQGILSTVFSVRDVEQARRYFTERGTTVVDGTAPGSIAVAPEENRGIRFEFAE